MTKRLDFALIFALALSFALILADCVGVLPK